MKPKYSLVRVRASRRLLIPSILATALAFALGVKPTQAQSTWSGASAGTWSTAGNWTPSGVPTSATDVTVLGPLNVAGALTINVDVAAAANSINFTNTAATTLSNTTSGSNKTLTLNSSGTAITTAATGLVTIGSATANQAVNVALGASQTWNVGAGGLTVNNVISGSGFGITKSGTGTLTLGSASNTFNGGIIVNAGNLTSAANGSLANNSITFSNNAIFTTASTDATTGGITLNNSGFVRLVNNNSSFSVGGKVTGGGGFEIERGGNGSITVNLNATTNDFTGGISYIHRQQNQSATVSVNSFVDTTVSGTGNIVFGATPVGSTGISVSHNFNYGSGATAGLTLANRRIQLGSTTQVVQAINNNSGQALTISSDLLVSGSNGKILTLGGTGAGLSTFSGTISNATTPITGTTLAAGWTSSGLTTGFTSGSTSLMLASVEGIAVGATISGTNIPASTTVSAINPITNVVTLSNGMTTLPTLGSTITVAGVTNSVKVIKADSGTWVLSGANTYTGGTIVTAGTLSFANGSLGTTGSIIMNGGTLRWDGSNTQDISSRLVMVAATTATLNTNGNTVTLATAFGGSTSGALTKAGAGTLILNGANTYTGATTVSAGTLRAGTDTAFGTTAGGVSITAGAVVDLNGRAIGAEAFTLNGTGISAGGALINSSATAASVGGAVTMGSATSIVPGSGNITLSSTLGMSTFALTKGGANALTLNGVVSGSKTVNTVALQINNGTVATGISTGLATNNTFTGDIAVDGTGSVFQINSGFNGYTTTAPWGTVTGGTSTKQMFLTNGGAFRLAGGTVNINNVTTTNIGAGIIFNIGSGGGVLDVADGATLIIDDGTATTTAAGAAQLQGTGNLTKSGLGIFQFDDSTAYAGTITVTAGTIQPASANAFGAVAAGTTIQSGAQMNVNGITMTNLEPLTINGTGLAATPLGALTNTSATAATWVGTVNVATDSHIGGNSGALTVSGVISGSGALSKVGSNTVRITGNNSTYAAGMSVLAGTLEIGTSANAAGSGTIQLGDTTGSANATLTCISSVTHANAITVRSGSSGTKTLALIAAPATVFSGLITMNDNLTISNTGTGTLTTGLNSPSATNSIDTNGKILTIANTSSGRYFADGVIYGTGSVVMNTSGSGDWVPRGDHTYSGGTTLTAGLIAVDRDSIGTPGSPTSGPFGTGTLIINGGQMRSGTSVAAGRSVGNAVTLGGDTTFFTISGERDLTFTGPVTISGGSRTITSTVGNTVAGKSAIFTGAIGDGGNALGLTKAGTGNLTLGGANTYTGDTVVNAGTLILSGSLPTNRVFTINPNVATGANLSLLSGNSNPLSSVSALTIGSATGPTGILLELGANTAASDSIITPNAANTAGTVNFTILPLAGFGAALSYDLVTASGGLTGANYALTSAPGGYTYSLAATGSAVTLNVTPTTAGDIYWRGNNNNSWSAFTGVNTNWYSDAAGITNAQANPGTGDTVIFSTTNAAGPIISTTLDNNFTVKKINFSSSPGSVTAVNVAGGLTPASLPGVLTIAPTSSADGISVASNAGAVTISAPVILGANQTWSVNGTGANGSSLTVSGAVTGTGTLDISGLVTLSAPAGSNTYIGQTNVSNGGILQGGVANNLSATSAMNVTGTGILRLNGISNTVSVLTGDGIVQNNSASTAATLTVGDATSTTFSGILQNGAAATLALTKVGAGILTLSGTNTYTGGTTISVGTIQQGVANALPTGVALTVNGTSVFDLNGLNASVSTLGGVTTGIVTDNAAGAGTSTLSITAAGSSAVNITNGATRAVALRVTNELGGFLLTNGSNTFSGGIVLTNSTGGTRMSPGVVTAGAYGTGPITVGESPTDLATIYFASNTSLANPLVVNTALGADRVGIRVDATVTLSGQLTANLAPVTFATNGTGTLNATGKITGPSGLVLAPNPYDLTTARTLTVNLNNTAGTNDYAGDTIVNLNPLLLKSTTLTLLAADQIPNGSGKGNVIVNSNGTGIGQLSLAGFNETINGLSGNGNVVNSLAGTYTLTLGDNNANGNHTGAINNTAGTLNVTKIGSGIQTLASPVGVGGSGFSGTLNVNGGLVAFPSSPPTAGPLGNSTAVNLNGGGLSYTGSTSNALSRPVAIGAGTGTFDVTSLAGTLTVPGTDVSSSGGNLVKTGPGTLSLSGTTSLNGGLAGVVVSAGRLQAGFGSAGIATINVGASGNLSLQNAAIQNLTLDNSAGALTVAGGARLGFECDGTTNDSIAVGVTGTPAMAAGVITLDLINFGAGVANGNTYTLLTTTVGDLTNAGATTYALGNAPSGFNYTVNVSSTAVSVTVSAFSPAYWTNSQSSGSWSTLNAGPLSNFSTDVAGLTNLAALPGSNETVSLSSSIIAGPTVATTLDGNFTLYGLNFIAGSGTVTTVSVDQGSSGTLTIRPSAVAGGIDVGTNAGNVTISAPLVASNTNSATQTWNVDGTGVNGSSLTLNGVTTFTANVIKTGAGVLTLGNAGNTGTGNFTLAGGTLSISDAGNLPTGVLTIGAGTTINNSGVGTVSLANSAYTWNGDFSLTGQSLDQGLGAVTLGASTQATVVTNTLTVGGVIDDGAFTYGITKAGAGTLVLSGNSTYGGATNVTAGTLNLTGSLTGGGAVATSGTGILSESSLGVISGASTVTQASSGTSVLAGANTYSGLTAITSGVLRITNASSLGATTAGTTQSGTSALELDGTGGAFTVGAEPLTINGGGVSGSDGALRNITGNNIYGGTVTMTAQSRINSDAGTLTLSNSTSVTGVAQSLLVGGAGNVTISGAIATTTGGVTKDGTGTLTLGGTNAYTGNTTLSAGVLNITGSITGNGTTTNLVYGNSAGNTIVNVSGSINNYKNFQGANISGSVAVMNQTGGSTTTLGTNSADTQWVAQNGGYGYLNITGGVFNTGRFDAVAPTGGGATAVIYVGGSGTFNNNVGDWLILPRTNGTGQLTVGPGGSLVRTAAVTNNFAITMDGSNSYGALNVAGGTVDTGVRPFQFGFGSAAASTGNRGFVNVAGGTLSVGAAINQTNTTAGASYFDYFNFAGGTVRSNAAITWLPATSANQHTLAATLYGPVTNNNNANAAFNTQIGTTSNFTGGVTVDTNGFATTIAYPLSAATGFGVTQANVGDLSLRAGNSGYIGAPAVVFSPPSGAGIPASGYAVIDAGTGQVTGIVITNPGIYAENETPTITLTGGGGNIAAFATTALTTANVSGGLTKTGNGTLTLTGANTYIGTTVVSGGTLQLNGSAAGAPNTSALTVNNGGTFGFTATSPTTLSLTGKSMTLSGGTLNFDVGASGVNDSIVVDNFTLAANSAFTFNSLGGLSEGNTYTLLTSTNPIANSGPFTITGQTIGRVTLTPTINNAGPYTISVTADVDESAWGVDSGGNWSVAGNWTGYLPETAGDAALFGSVITAPRTVAVDTPQSVGFIRFNNANAYTIGANGSSFLTLNNGTNNAVVSVTTGSHTIAENVALLSNALFKPASGTQVTVSGIVSGASRNVEVNGDGEVVLSGINTYSGTTTVSNGALTLTGNRTATMGNVTVGNLNGKTGTLNVSNGSFSTGTFLLGFGNGTAIGVVNHTAGTINLTGTALIMGNGGSGGTLAGAGGNGTYHLSGGTLTATPTANRGVMLGTNDGGTSTFNLSGTGTLTLTGTSVLMVGRSDSNIVNTTNLFNQTGGTANVTNFTIGGAAAAATGLNSTFTVTGGTFSATAFNNLGAGDNGTVAINIGGTGQVTLPAFPSARGSGTTTTITFDSTTGYLRPTAASTSYMPVSNLTTAKLTANGAKIDTNGFDITIAQVLQDNTTLGTLTKVGAGNLTLSGVNTYTGTTTISAGTLTINEGSIAGSSNIVNNAALAYVLSTNARTYSGPITGTGTLTKSGTNTLTLGGTNSYTGATTVSAGTLQISGSTNNGSAVLTVGSASAGSLTIATGGSFVTTGSLNIGAGIIGNALTVQTGASINVAAINNPWGTNYTVDGTLTSAGMWTVSTNQTTNTFNGSGTINASALTLGNATTGVNYTGSGTINLAGAVTVASTGAGNPFYTQTSGTLNAASMLLGDAFAGTRTFNLNGGRVNLGAGGIAATGAGASTKAVNLGAGTLGARANWSSSLNMALTSATPGVTINTLDSVDNTTARTITLSGILSGATFALNKSGDGTLILTNANTYTGATTINAGTLQLGDAGTTGALSASSAITNNSSLVINRTNAVLQNASFGAVSGTGTFTQAGTGTTTLNTANTYTGNTILSAGILNAGVAETAGTSGPFGNQLATAAGTILFSGGTLQYSAANTFDYSGRFSSAASQNYRVDTNGQNVTWAGDLTSSDGTLTKSGTGTLTLSGNSSYSGGTTISGGIVQANHNNALGSGTVTVNGGVRVAVNAGVDIPNAVVLGPNAGGSGRGLVEAAGISGTATVSGPITINNGASAGGHFNAAAGTVLHVKGVITSTVIDVGTGRAIFSHRAGDVMFSGGGTGYELLQNGQGTTMVGANNGIATTARVNIGASAAGNLDLNGFNQSLDGIAKGANAATIGNSSTTSDSVLTTTGTSSFAGVIQDVLGAGTRKLSLTVASGDLTLTGANTYSGGTTVNQGTLTVGTGGTLGATTGTLSVNNSNTGAGNAAVLNLATAANTTVGSLSGSIATPTSGVNSATINTQSGRVFTVNQTTDGTFAGVIAGSGDFVLGASSTNTLTLTGANTYTGTTTVSAGTLALVGGSQASPITVSAGASLGFTLGSPTTSTGTFNLTNGTIKITGTPTLPSYTLITDSAGITGTPTLDAPIAGYSLVKQGNSLVLISPLGLYDAWTNATYVPPLTAKLKTDDQDGDTFINLMEYAFGTQPTVNSSAPLSYTGGVLNSTGQPILVKEAGVWYAVFGRRKDYVEAGLTYTVEFSNSLATWVDNVTVPTVIATDGTIDAVRVPFPNFIDGPSGPQKPTFFRVEVQSSF